MYQDVLDALNACKTARQHLNAMEKLSKNSAADPHLQAHIANFGAELQRWLLDISKKAKQKTATAEKKNIMPPLRKQPGRTSSFPLRLCPMEQCFTPLQR